MNQKLVLDSDGNVAAYLISPGGGEITAYDTEIVTILDRFVAEHPDSPYKGAKGIIALTGFNGVLDTRPMPSVRLPMLPKKNRPWR